MENFGASAHFCRRSFSAIPRTWPSPSPHWPACRRRGQRLWRRNSALWFNPAPNPQPRRGQKKPCFQLGIPVRSDRIWKAEVRPWPPRPNNEAPAVAIAMASPLSPSRKGGSIVVEELQASLNSLVTPPAFIRDALLADVRKGAADVSRGTANLSRGTDTVSRGAADLNKGAANVCTGAADASSGATDLRRGTVGIGRGAAHVSPLLELERKGWSNPNEELPVFLVAPKWDTLAADISRGDGDIIALPPLPRLERKRWPNPKKDRQASIASFAWDNCTATDISSRGGASMDRAVMDVGGGAVSPSSLATPSPILRDGAADVKRGTADTSEGAAEVSMPLSLQRLKRARPHPEGKLEGGGGIGESFERAFSSMVFMMKLLQSHALHLLSFGDLQDLLSLVHRELHLSFVWLFQQVFVRTPDLMLLVMLLLANFTVFSMDSHIALASAPTPVATVSTLVANPLADGAISPSICDSANSGGADSLFLFESANSGGGTNSLFLFDPANSGSASSPSLFEPANPRGSTSPFFSKSSNSGRGAGSLSPFELTDSGGATSPPMSKSATFGGASSPSPPESTTFSGASSPLLRESAKSSGASSSSLRESATVSGDFSGNSGGGSSIDIQTSGIADRDSSPSRAIRSTSMYLDEDPLRPALTSSILPLEEGRPPPNFSGEEATNRLDGISATVRSSQADIAQPSGGPGLECDDYLCFDRTELMYRHAIEKDSSNPLLLANYAQFLYTVRHDHQRALELFERALRVDPTDAEVNAQFANFLWLASGDTNAAEKAYQAAISADPENPFHAGNYAHFLWSTGDENDGEESDTCLI